MEYNNIRGIFKKLEHLYPDKKIVNLTKHKKLYQRIFNLSKRQECSMEDFLKSFGYEYIYLRQAYELEDILKDLNKNYPNKKIKSLHKNKRLYQNLDKLAKDKNCSLEEFLEDLGYQYVKYNALANKKTTVIANNLNYRDLKTMQYAINNYKVTATYFCELLGISRQRISDLIKKECNNPQNWLVDKFEKEDLILIDYCLSKQILEYKNENTQLLISENKNVKCTYMLFLRKDNTVKFMFELTKEIKNIFQKYEYDKYNIDDKKIISELNKIITEKDIKDNLNVFDKYKLPKNIRSILATRSNKHNMNKIEYLQYLGFKEFDSKKNQSRIRVKKILQQYLSEDGYVKIPVDAKEYHAIMAYANNNFKNIKNLCEHFGFKYERTKNDKFKKEYEELKNYIVKENKIYLESESRIYRTILGASKVRKFNSIDDFLNSLGYERIKDKIELPKKYKMYDWRSDELRLYPHLYSNNKIIDYLEKYYGKEKIILLTSGNHIYSKLKEIASVRKENLYDMLSNLGYIINKKGSIKKSKSIKSLKNKQNFIKIKLVMLKSLNKDIIINDLNFKKLKRNQKLVKLLKELYKNQCQLCDSLKKELYIPPIYKMDGSIYSEVHHINNLSNTQEEESLDTYENAIVVCPYHHKVLHFENGGYKEIIKNNNMLYFKSKYGNLLKIHKNYHLKEGLFKNS